MKYPIQQACSWFLTEGWNYHENDAPDLRFTHPRAKGVMLLVVAVPSQLGQVSHINISIDDVHSATLYPTAATWERMALFRALIPDPGLGIVDFEGTEIRKDDYLVAPDRPGGRVVFRHGYYGVDRGPSHKPELLHDCAHLLKVNPLARKLNNLAPSSKLWLNDLCCWLAGEVDEQPDPADSNECFETGLVLKVRRGIEVPPMVNEFVYHQNWFFPDQPWNPRRAFEDQELVNASGDEAVVIEATPDDPDYFARLRDKNGSTFAALLENKAGWRPFGWST